MNNAASQNPPRFNSANRCGNNNIAAVGLNQSNKNTTGTKMSQDLMVKNQNDAELSLVEQVVVQGDLSKLDPAQRVLYYRKVCESAGLNPFTKPFEYIVLNGKLTLYAKKDATEQLRKINGISIESLETVLMEDLYIVKAYARSKDGRTDAATGAVTIGHLKGDAKANAIMKAETKAKRRVTLSISGLGWVDETEVESIPGAKTVEVDLETGEIKNSIVTITAEQAKELEMILGDCEISYRNWVLTNYKQQFNISSLKDLPADIFNKVKQAAVANMESNRAKQIQPLVMEQSLFEEPK
jgi:copper chaperone CopZ